MLKGIKLFKRFCDNVWEYDIPSGQIFMHHSTTMPELCGVWRSYDERYLEHKENYVYAEDIGIWEHYMSKENLSRLLKKENGEEHFFVRTKHKECDMEWHEVYLERISSKRIFIGSRDINEVQRNATIAQAVLTQFDYVCRIDIVTNGYMLYYSDNIRGEVPRPQSDNYYEEVLEFAEKYVVFEEREQFCKNMMLENVLHQLKEKKEYVLYATEKYGEKLAYKKLRFWYADERKRALLLTRADVTGIMEERKKMAQEEQKRIQYLENMPIGFCSVKVLLDENGQPKDFCYTYCNRAHEQLEGAAPGELIGKKFYEYFDNADPKWLKYYYETAYHGVSHDIREYSPEIGKELQIRTFQTQKGYCDCVIRDITKETFLTRELQKSREELRRILKTTTAVLFQYDPLTRKISVSKSEGGLSVNIPDEEAVELLIGKGELHGEYADAILEMFQEIRDGKNYASIVIRARNKTDKPWAWYKVVLFDYYDDFTRKRVVLGYLQNVNRDMSEQEQLRKKAQIDALTGIFNVGEGEKQIEEALAKQRKETNIYNAMFLMDIDDFKHVNDTFGHIKGDETLKRFAKVLKDTFRSVDVVYRLGGDEFAAFAKDIKMYQTTVDSIMHRLNQNLEEARKEFPFLHVSVGIFVSNNTKEYYHYYKEADRALYETKRNGKNHYMIRTDSDLENTESMT